MTIVLPVIRALSALRCTLQRVLELNIAVPAVWRTFIADIHVPRTRCRRSVTTNAGVPFWTFRTKSLMTITLHSWFTWSQYMTQVKLTSFLMTSEDTHRYTQTTAQNEYKDEFPSIHHWLHTTHYVCIAPSLLKIPKARY